MLLDAQFPYVSNSSLCEIRNSDNAGGPKRDHMSLPANSQPTERTDSHAMPRTREIIKHTVCRATTWYVVQNHSLDVFFPVQQWQSIRRSLVALLHVARKRVAIHEISQQDWDC